MLLSKVSCFFSKLILTNNDGHFECFSLKNVNIRTYLKPSGTVVWRNHPQTDSPGGIPERIGSGAGH